MFSEFSTGICKLQPLNLCLTYQGTVGVIKKLSEKYDEEAKAWATTLESEME